MICSSSRILTAVRLLHGLVSRNIDAALGSKKVIVVKVEVQKEVKCTLEPELKWFWFTSEKNPWEKAMPSKPSGWSKKTSFPLTVQCIQILPMQVTDQSLRCSGTQHRVSRLMKNAKLKHFGVGSHRRLHPLAD